MKKIANKIQIVLGLKGQGLVNYNGDKPPIRFIKDMISDGEVTKNGSFAKENGYKVISVNDNGDKIVSYEQKKIISGNLLRKFIIGDENDVNADKLSLHSALRVAYVSQDTSIARGYCCTQRGDDGTLSRKSSFTVCDAEQTSGAISWIETRNTEGKKDKTSLFFKENCGKIEYESEIFLDVPQLKFVSIDDNYDRMSLEELDVEPFIKHIGARYGEGNAVYGNWGTTHKNLVGEQGIVLSNKVVTNIIRESIKRMLSIEIKRATTFAKTSSIKIAIGYPGDEIDLLAKPKFFEIYNIGDYDKLVEGIEFGIDYLPIEITLFPKVEKKEKKIIEKKKKAEGNA